MATLARAFDAEVCLYVQDGEGDETVPDGYRIVDTGPRRARLSRMSRGAWRMIGAVRRARPAIAHFHDPELLPWAVLLRLYGIKVVYDVHEDVPRQIQHNMRLHPLLRRALSPLVSLVEWCAARLLSAVVTATPEIAARFPARKTVIVANYPMIEEFVEPGREPMAERDRTFVYIGGLTRLRGLFSMTEAIERLGESGACLRLAGDFVKEEERDALAASPGWTQVRYEGWVNRAEVGKILSTARAGLVTLLPIRNYIEARPIKLFEYMAAGLPVIASDFPRWRDIVEGSQCGILVDPTDAEAIASAMRWILDHPDEAQDMGVRGRQAVLDRYNWNSQAENLVTLYRSLLNDRTI
ncbi:MAG: glycosyltransferase family 4 protein [Sphingopyxis granuli]|uniref:glycosyltransferase family 4 protein n=1 Tax=Sphingopyxis granuli TaxID=267128 RepID=UPI003C789BEA